MFYEERVISLFPSFEVALPFTRREVNRLGGRYLGYYKPEHSYWMIATFELSAPNKIHHAYNPRVRYGPEDIRRLKVSPNKPSGIFGQLFPIRFRSV